MIDLKNIYNELGITPIYAEEVIKINNRLIDIVKRADESLENWDMMGTRTYKDIYINEIKFVLGVNVGYNKLVDLFITGATEKILVHNVKHYNIFLSIIEKLAEDEFYKAICIKTALAFEYTLIDVGFIFNREQGKISKSNASELDEKITHENLTWLVSFPDSRKKYSQALSQFFAGEYPDSITNAYSAWEGLVKNVLNSDARFDKTETVGAITKKLGFEADWNQLFVHYAKIANEISSRHGKKVQNIEVKDEELEKRAEFFLFLTGTFIRVLSRSI